MCTYGGVTCEGGAVPTFARQVAVMCWKGHLVKICFGFFLIITLICVSEHKIMSDLVDFKTILGNSLGHSNPGSFDVWISLWFAYQPLTL